MESLSFECQQGGPASFVLGTEDLSQPRALVHCLLESGGRQSLLPRQRQMLDRLLLRDRGSRFVTVMRQHRDDPIRPGLCSSASATLA